MKNERIMHIKTSMDCYGTSALIEAITTSFVYCKMNTFLAVNRTFCSWTQAKTLKSKSWILDLQD
jgi:hypothetical protein